ncbi:MAG: acylphosphatase [Candidatus Bipolaricaulota bacterium]
MSKERAHLKITGRVQGVGFRAGTRHHARDLGLTGWVKNLSDGSVEGVIEGEEDEIKQLISWAKSGPPRAMVEEVKVDWKEHEDEFQGFSTRY